jgi:hypothetical protein
VPAHGVAPGAGGSRRRRRRPPALQLVAQSAASLLDVDTGVAFVASNTLELDMVVSRSLSGNASQEVRGGLSVSSRF